MHCKRCAVKRSCLVQKTTTQHETLHHTSGYKNLHAAAAYLQINLLLVPVSSEIRRWWSPDFDTASREVSLWRTGWRAGRQGVHCSAPWLLWSSPTTPRSRHSNLPLPRLHPPPPPPPPPHHLHLLLLLQLSPSLPAPARPWHDHPGNCAIQVNTSTHKFIINDY